MFASICMPVRPPSHSFRKGMRRSHAFLHMGLPNLNANREPEPEFKETRETEHANCSIRTDSLTQTEPDGPNRSKPNLHTKPSEPNHYLKQNRPSRTAGSSIITAGRRGHMGGTGGTAIHRCYKSRIESKSESVCYKSKLKSNIDTRK
jgi:hypothetical protein